MAANHELTPTEASRWSCAGMLGALAIVLGYLETFVPIPIPGVKLGLANIAVLIALSQGERRTAVAVAVIKVLASGLLFGNPVTMAYSAAGTALSLLVMLPLSRLATLHLAMLSVAGALAHEVGQLLVAQVILGTPLVWYSSPVLLVAGVATGALSGAVAARTATLIGTVDASANDPQVTGRATPETKPAGTRSKVLLVAFLAFVVATLKTSGLVPAVTCAAIAAAFCAIARVKARDLLKACRPVLPILVITFVAQLLSLPPERAILSAGLMALRLAAITAAAVGLVRAIPRDEVMGLANWVLSPLLALGVRTDGPVLALDVAMNFVPVFAEGLEARMASENLRVFDRRLWTDVLPGVIAELYARA